MPKFNFYFILTLLLGFAVLVGSLGSGMYAKVFRVFLLNPESLSSLLYLMYDSHTPGFLTL